MTSSVRRSGKFYARNLLKGSMAMTLAEASAKIVKLLVTPVLTYYLSPQDFGVIASIRMVQGFLMLVYNPGMISGISRIYYETEDAKKRKEYIGSGLLFFILFSGIISLSLIFAGEDLFKTVFNEFELYPYGIVAILLSLLVQPKRLWSSLMTFKYKVPRVALFSFLQIMIDIGVTLFLVAVLLFGVEGRVIGMISGSVFIAAVALVYLISYARNHMSIKISWKLLLYGLPLAPAIWAYAILNIADRFMIEHFLGLDNLGLYSVGYIIASVPLFVSMGFRKMWNPIFYENMNSGNHVRIKLMIKFYMLGMAIVCSVMILFSKEIVTVMLDKSFENSSLIIPWVTSGVFFLSILPLSTSFITYEKKFGKVSLNAGISAGLNIILNIILLPRIGIVGAAITTLISYIVYFLLNVYVVRKTFISVVPFIYLIPPLVFLTGSVFIYYFLSIGLIYAMLVKVVFIVAAIFAFYLFNYISSNEIVMIKSLFLNKKN